MAYSRDLDFSEYELLRDLIAIRLELFAESLELATARRVLMALTARHSGLSCEFRFCVRRRHPDKRGCRAQCESSRNSRYRAKASQSNGIEPTKSCVFHERPPSHQQKFSAVAVPYKYTESQAG